MLKFSEKAHRFVWLVGVLAIFCFCQTVIGQSGRRTKKETDVPPQTTDAPRQTAPVRLPQAEIDEPEESAPAVRVGSLKLVGEVQHNAAYYRSNELDNALKEGVRAFKDYAKTPLQLARGGRMNYTQAKEAAQKETGTFVLWLGFSTNIDNYGSIYLDFIQYAVLKPQTGRVLKRGQIVPGQPGITRTGGVLQLPPQTRRLSSHLAMRLGTREIAALLIRGGWIK